MQIIIKILLTILLAALMVPQASAQASSSYCLIVNQNNAMTQISRTDVARIYLGKKTLWTSGKRIKPVMLDLQDAVVEQFVRELLTQSSAQFRTYWRKRLFSGGGAPPRVLHSQEEALTYVRKYPFAIGIVERTRETSGHCLDITG